MFAEGISTNFRWGLTLWVSILLNILGLTLRHLGLPTELTIALTLSSAALLIVFCWASFTGKYSAKAPTTALDRFLVFAFFGIAAVLFALFLYPHP
jgi:TRAP-type C4-dicarboxylate transport system permease small subunit